MNTRFLVSLACAAGLAVAVPASALARNDDAARNMVIGGIAGAIIGENNDHHAAEGAAIGAAAGLLLTALADSSDYDRGYSSGYYGEPPRCRETVVVSRPYGPPHRTVVVAPAYSGWYHDRDYREHRREARYDHHRDYRHDRRDDRWNRRDDRRDGRNDRHGRD